MTPHQIAASDESVIGRALLGDLDRAMMIAAARGRWPGDRDFADEWNSARRDPAWKPTEKQVRRAYKIAARLTVHALGAGGTP